MRRSGRSVSRGGWTTGPTAPARTSPRRRWAAAGTGRGIRRLPGFRLAAQAGREVGDRADGAVVPAALEADRADGRVALRDADAEGELPAALAPSGREVRHAIAHRDRHADR